MKYKLDDREWDYEMLPAADDGMVPLKWPLPGRFYAGCLVDVNFRNGRREPYEEDGVRVVAYFDMKDWITSGPLLDVRPKMPKGVRPEWRDGA